MKKLTLSLVSILALGSFAFADGSDSSALWKPAKSAVYGGLAYGYFKENVHDIDLFATESFELKADTVMLQAGYRYNPYVSVEARYWLNTGDIRQSGGSGSGTHSGSVNSWGMYVKPNIPLSNTNINVYALFGYGDTTIKYSGGNKWDTNGYSWGYGVEYEPTPYLGIFIDYVQVGSADSFDYDGEDGIDAEIDVSSVNFGLNYKFNL